jgi:hypothetical protein
MPQKDINLCLDENFHGPHICLVGIEPVSNFILIEAYRDTRDSLTWSELVNDAVDGLPVTVLSITSDQASGLIRCAEKELEIHHQPDLMHLQADLFRPILLPLARPIQQAQKALEKIEEEGKRLDELERQDRNNVCIQMLLDNILAKKQAQKDLAEAEKPMKDAVEQIRTMSKVYHPFDRESGKEVTAKQMQNKLKAPLAKLQEIVEEEELPERAMKGVEKARGWVVLLVGCLGWFWTVTRQRLEELDLSEEQQRMWRECLMSSSYWEMAARREKDPQERKRLLEMAERLREEGWQEGGALAALRAEEKEEAQRVAQQCAELFSRSSSCVEGRNSRLSLFHHGQTRLSERRLKALTAVHNYLVRREDGTTAAERFFGQEQRDVFSWLLQRMPDLPRPAAKRRKSPSAEVPAGA